MSFLKISQDLFLETAELKRLKEFLDDGGWRQNLLQNSLQFGLIKEQFFLNGSINNEFLNGLVTQGSSLSLNYNAISAIDSDGNLISFPAGNIATTPDSNWYWLKIAYTTTNLEVGTVSIDAQGNLTGVGTKFTQVLRGQPNFPARITLPDSASNFLEYDVLEVISDTQAILDNNASFVAESDIHYQVVGTFTPDAVPANADKNIFNYDSCILTLVAESIVNTPPVFIAGKEFFLARVKSDGVNLIIQDKRTSIWKVKADFFAQNIQELAIPNFGVEKIKFNDLKSTLDKNFVYLSWTFRSRNYSVNSNLNIVTIIGGEGGKYKTVNDFQNGDFNGYRLYTLDGNYAIIKSSIRTGGQINLTLDVLDINLYSNDGGVTFTGNEIVITPDAEEIEIICSSQEDTSASDVFIGEGSLPDVRQIFPINTALAKVELLVYNNPTCTYAISYRMKHGDVYGKEFSMPSDTAFGYYTEIAFDGIGSFLPIVRSNTYTQNLTQGYIAIYNSNIIVLTINPNAYSIEISKINLGDIKGVDEVTLSNARPLVNLVVGANRQYQHYTGTLISLSADMYINLKTVDVNSNPDINGNQFFIHIDQDINLNGHSLKITYGNNATPSLNTVLKTFTENDIFFIANSEQGLFITASYDGTVWILNSVNEFNNDPIHTIKMFGGSTSGLFDGTGLGIGGGWVGWALCNGLNSTPNLRGKFIAGFDDSGGDADYNAIGNTGGEKKHLLLSSESGLPAHNHTQNPHTHPLYANDGGTLAQVLQTAHTNSGSDFANNTQAATATNNPNAAADAANPHENRPPYYTLAYVMKIV